MTRYLLDTNILSNAVKPTPSEALARWLSEREDENLYTSTMVVAEMRRGLLQMPSGRRRSTLETWLDGPDGPIRVLAGRILSFDERAAEIWARLMADGHRSGRPRGAIDMIIAATAVANDCVLVTDNERHFEGVAPILNPMR